jgi:transposase InsO family protein
MGIQAGGPVPGRGRGRVRGSVPAAEDLTAAIPDLITELRKDLAGQGLDAGPGTIAWHLEHHHQVTVSAATVSRYLARAGLVTPEPRKRPRSSCLRFAAELPNQCWQPGFTHYRLKDGNRDPDLAW